MSGPLLMRRYSTTGLLRLTNGLKAFYCLGFSCSVPATMTAIADAVRWAEEIMKEIDRRWLVRNEKAS